MTISNKARSGLTSLLFAAAFIPSIATAQIAPPVGQGQLGTAANSSGPTKPNSDIKVCCPPIAERSFDPFFTHHELPGKNVTQTYGMTFNASAALDAQMTAYAPFAALFAPTSWTGHSVLLHSEMRELTLPITAIPTSANFPGGILVNQGALRGWRVNGTIWNGPDTGSTYTWDKRFNDGNAVSPAFMKPNKLYMIKMTFRLGVNKPGVPDAWNTHPISCMTKYFVYGVNQPPMLAAGQGSNNRSAPTIVRYEVN